MLNGRIELDLLSWTFGSGLNLWRCYQTHLSIHSKNYNITSFGATAIISLSRQPTSHPFEASNITSLYTTSTPLRGNPTSLTSRHPIAKQCIDHLFRGFYRSGTLFEDHHNIPF